MRRFYVDTNIWIDYYENRKDRFRPLGEWALEFFKLIDKDKGEILFSEFVLEELGRMYGDKEIIKILDIVSNKKEVFVTESRIRESNILCRKMNIPKYDIIHAILARDNNAVMVTRDKHFIDLQEIADIKKPEDII